MSIVVDRMYDESEDIGLQDGSVELPFVIMGTASGLAARVALYAYLIQLGIDKTYHGYSLMNVGIKRQQAPTIFFASCRYSRVLNKIKVTWDGTAEKMKKTRSITNIANYRVRDIATLGTTGPDYGGLVNVGRDKVDGVEVYSNESPSKMTMQWAAKDQDIRADYWLTANLLKATVNDVQIMMNYKGQSLIFERGSLLFVGPTFDQSLNHGDGSEITLKFEFNFPNQVSIGERDGSNDGNNALINVEGWWYVWIRTRRVRDATAGIDVERPDSVHLEQMYEYADLTQLEVFDRVEGQDDELQDALEEEQEDEEAE